MNLILSHACWTAREEQEKTILYLYYLYRQSELE